MGWWVGGPVGMPSGTFSALALTWLLSCLPPQEKQEITSGGYPLPLANRDVSFRVC